MTHLKPTVQQSDIHLSTFFTNVYILAIAYAQHISQYLNQIQLKLIVNIQYCTDKFKFNIVYNIIFINVNAWFSFKKQKFISSQEYKTCVIRYVLNAVLCHCLHTALLRILSFKSSLI